MKFLHTADLHIGKIFHEQSFIKDQEFMLDRLLDILKDPSFQALVIAGDIYDRSIPPTDAIKIFGPFLGKLKQERPDLEILLISGNHDSPLRLSFGRELFAKLGVIFATEVEEANKPILLGKKGDESAFFLLPFLTDGSLKDDEGLPIRSQAKLAEEAAVRLEKARLEAVKAGAKHTVLVAHLFADGGEKSESERSFLGNAELVNINLFAGFDYVALGHLHRCQKIGNNAYYSGTPLAYSFKEAQYQQCFLSVTLGAAKPVQLTFEPQRRLSSIQASFEELIGDLSPENLAKKNDYLEIILSDTSFVDSALVLLRSRFPHLLHVKQVEAIKARLRQSGESVHYSTFETGRSLLEDFEDFLLDTKGKVDPEERDLFKELMAGLDSEEVQSSSEEISE